ncbi:MAG TPA: hypothetical protein VGH24_07950 [Solirubrobacteraceae bacterium]
MRSIARLGALAAAGALATAVPAVAANASEPSHPAPSHECTAHHVAFVASGKLVAWSVTALSNGRFAGTITVHVMRTDHHATSQKDTNVVFVLHDARVAMGRDATTPAVGDRIELVGSKTEVGKRCTTAAPAATTVTIHKVSIHAATGRS